MRRALAAVLGWVLCAGTPIHGAQVDRAALMTRVGEYVAAFERQFGSMVAEEKYEQFVTVYIGSRSRPAGPDRTVLRSDFLLVQLPGQGWVPFRDVFEHDGKAVRDRQDRLTALFLGNNTQDALEQAKRISDESARYNIGNIQRTINVPTLALVYLANDYQGRLSVTDEKADNAAPGRVIGFKEVARPTFIHTANDRDLPVTGRAWVDEATGTIERTELHVLDTTVEAHITVIYRLDETAKIWVPARMEERYKRPQDQFEVRGTATYSNFRHFSVSTTEDVKN